MNKENGSGAPKPRKGPGKVKVVLVSIALLAVGGACLLGLTQRNNIKALYMAATADPEKLEQQVADQETKRNQLLEQYGLTAPTRGETTPGDAATGQEPAAQPDQSAQPGQSAQLEEKPTAENAAGTASSAGSAREGELDQAAKEKLQGYVNELYALEDEYMAMLDRLIKATKEEYRALPKEQRTRENKIALVKSKTETLIAGEKQCDAEVEAILARIQALLDENKVKNNLVSDIRARYEDSKATWKAARMTELYK